MTKTSPLFRSTIVVDLVYAQEENYLINCAATPSLAKEMLVAFSNRLLKLYTTAITIR